MLNSDDVSPLQVVEAIQRAGIEKTVYGYAEEYLYLENGEKFSFDKHNYLIDLYLDNHPYIVIEKSAQMGASIFAIAKAYYVCDKKNKNVIYFFPTDSDVMDFSQTRVSPIVKNSPHLTAITGKDTLGLRQVGHAWMYFRGMKSKIAMKSIPADFLIFDELDEVSSTAESLADQRLNHSTMKWRLKLSTPTFEGYGIDREFQASDQRYWNLICRSCNTRNIVEKTFPDCVLELDEMTAILVCQKCKSRLDPQYGEWIADNPNTHRIHGYHICGLYSEYLTLSETMREYREGRQRDEFFRSKLGMPYTNAEQRITLSMIQSCMDLSEMRLESHCYMGVDQKGDELHIVIRKPSKIMRKSEVLQVAKVKVFGQLDDYMRRYDVDLCVIDGTPNQHSARDFAKRFPGRVYLCYYQDSQKGSYNWKEPRDGEAEWAVDVNRTEALDAMYEQIQRREVSLPVETPEMKEFATQLTMLARVNIKDDDGAVTKAVWQRLGADHFAHASSYSLIAQSKFGIPTNSSSIVIKSKAMAARIVQPRLRSGRF